MPELPAGSGFTYSTIGPSSDERQDIETEALGRVQVPQNIVGFEATQGHYAPPPDQSMQQFNRIMADMPLNNIAEAAAAVNMAIKFQSMRGYQRDLEAGVPQSEALARHAVGLMGDRGGAAFASMMRLNKMTPYQEAMASARNREVALKEQAASADNALVKEQVIPGVWAVRTRGGNTVHIVKESGDQLSAKEALKILPELGKVDLYQGLKGDQSLSAKYGPSLQRIIDSELGTEQEPTQPKQLSKEIAAKFVAEAKGDKELARKMAKDAGYTF